MVMATLSTPPRATTPTVPAVQRTLLPEGRNGYKMYSASFSYLCPRTLLTWLLCPALTEWHLCRGSRALYFANTYNCAYPRSKNIYTNRFIHPNHLYVCPSHKGNLFLYSFVFLVALVLPNQFPLLLVFLSLPSSIRRENNVHIPSAVVTFPNDVLGLPPCSLHYHRCVASS